jgi:predicted nuclease of restriction endonuclease-like (RecB) superfamily
MTRIWFFVAVPSSLPSDVEHWYVDQVVTMTKKRNMADGGALPP